MKYLVSLLLIGSFAHSETEDQYVAKAVARAHLSWKKKHDKKLIADKVREKYKSKIESLREDQKAEIEAALEK